jgi:hypothetical protein
MPSAPLPASNRFWGDDVVGAVNTSHASRFNAENEQSSVRDKYTWVCPKKQAFRGVSEENRTFGEGMHRCSQLAQRFFRH